MSTLGDSVTWIAAGTSGSAVLCQITFHSNCSARSPNQCPGKMWTRRVGVTASGPAGIKGKILHCQCSLHQECV
eukprot:2037283-Rhodomonas_salina.5